MPVDRLYVDRTAAYVKGLKERTFLYLDLLFPEIGGSRMPVFTQQLDERAEYMKLSETRKNATLAQQGQVPGDFETEAWMQNRDGAQERLIELQKKFEALQ